MKKSNLSVNSKMNSNFWAKLKALFALPKWAKIFLGVLSVVALAGLLGAFALQSWAKDKIQHGEFVLNGTDKGWQERLESGFAYDSRLYFEKADFLLRSKVIAYIDIRDISWVSPIDKNAVSELKSRNRHIKFSTSQNLSEFNGQKLGVVEYKMDFSPLFKTVVKYYFGILIFIFLCLCVINLIILDKFRFDYIAYILVGLGIIVRIYQYIFHKDLWVDEAMIAYSMYGIGWSELFFAQLPMQQSAPVFFVVLSKFLCGIFGYNELVLYFLPCVFGIFTLVLAYKIAKLLFGDNSFGLLAFVVLVCGSLGLLYYSAEFKQYSIEAFFSFLLIYFYLKNLEFKKFIVISVLCFLSSHTGVFVSFACIAGYLYKTLPLSFHLKVWIKNNTSYILFSAILAILFVLYYFIYVRYQAVVGFYAYWKPYLIPLNLFELPSFFMRILPVYNGFTPFDNSGASLIFMLVSCIGLYALWKDRRDLFIVCIGMLAIYVGLSVCQIYPFGHGGIIGGRLSLFMSVFFYIMCASGATYLYDKISLKWCKDLCVVCLLALALFGAYKNAQKFLPEHRHIEQTHAFISQIAEEYTESKLAESNKCVFVFESAQPMFLYYSHIDNLNIPHKVFDGKFNLENFDNKFGELNCQKSWILASHYPSGEWVDSLIAYTKSLNENAKIKTAKTGWGTILIRIE